MENVMNVPGITMQRAETIWDTLCFVGCDGAPFKTKDVIAALVKWHGNEGAVKTWQCSWDIFRRWALNNAEEFSGPCSKLTQLASGTYRLDDNPER